MGLEGGFRGQAHCNIKLQLSTMAVLREGHGRKFLFRFCQFLVSDRAHLSWLHTVRNSEG